MSEEKKKVVKAVKVKKVQAKVAAPKAEAAGVVVPKAEVSKAAPKTEKPVVEESTVKELTPGLFEEAKRTEPVQDVPLSTPRQAKETALAAASEPKELQKEAVPFWKKWWFWLIVAGLALAAFALFTQGGSGKDAGTSPTTTTAQNGAVELTTGQETTAKAGLLDVTVTLPKDFFEGETPEQIQASAKEAGYSSCVVNADGSVTYTMSKLKQSQILREFKSQIDTTIGEMTGGSPDAPQSYKSISYDKDVTTFDVRVDRAAFESNQMDAMYALGLYLLGGYYQMFDGVPESQVDVTVHFIDDSNGETFQSGSYQEAMQNLNTSMF